MTQNAANPRRTQDNPFRVLGIAMIVDQRGVGARLVARYPTQPSVPTQGGRYHSGGESMLLDDGETADGETIESTSFAQGFHHQSDGSTNRDTNGTTNNSEDDLFFTLTPRQMAKLFRTKKSLCGQPMTLNVNGTVYCCRAILMQDEDTTTTPSAAAPSSSIDEPTTTPISAVAPATASDTANNSNKDQLELFSVIVALSSPVGTSSIPFAGWYDGSTDDQLDLQRYMADISSSVATKTNVPRRPTSRNTQKAGRISASFLSIRRVHLSLARFCRVLEREEHRCHYVSLQANQFLRIRGERQKKWEEQKAIGNGGGPQHSTRSGGAAKQGSTSGGASTTSVGTNQSTPDHHRRGSKHHRRSGSLSTVLGGISSSDRGAVGGTGGTGDERSSSIPASLTSLQQREQELEQEILELMMAAPSSDHEASDRQPTEAGASMDGGAAERQQRQHHHGNLVRELVQVFHSLARNDHEFPPTAAALLSERDGVVYVNQHIAIPVEALSPSPVISNRTGAVRPYHTLLFPHASPSELLQTFQSSGSAAPQRLQQLLLTVNPQKALSDIAIDANLPLFTTMEIASYLVAHGACVTSPVVSRSSRLACFQIYRIPHLALEFSQTFHNVDLFRLISFLTSSKTLGEAMSTLTNLDSVDGQWLRESLPTPTLTSMLRSSSLTSLGQSEEIHLRNVEGVLTGSSKEQSPANTGANLAAVGGQGQTQSQLQQSQQTPQQPQQPQQQAQQHTQQPRRWVEELEELLYAMAIWLLSHRVLSQVQEYLVAVEKSDDANASDKPGAAQSQNQTNCNLPLGATDTSGDSLLRELLEADVLSGSVSISALCWRLSLDPSKLRSWGIRHEQIRIVSRIPAPGDDWESRP